MEKVAKMLLGPLAGGTIYDSPIAQFLSIKDPAEKRRLAAEAEAEAKKSAAPGAKQAPGMKHGGAVKKMAKGGKLTDLTGDGKVTRADVLKGRGVKGFSNGGMPSIEESIKSGNRVSEQVGKETKRMMPPKKRTMPSPGESVKSGNRMYGENAKDLKAVKKYAKGGVTRADGCAVRGKTKGKMV